MPPKRRPRADEENAAGGGGGGGQAPGAPAPKNTAQAKQPKPKPKQKQAAAAAAAVRDHDSEDDHDSEPDDAVELFDEKNFYENNTDSEEEHDDNDDVQDEGLDGFIASDDDEDAASNDGDEGIRRAVDKKLNKVRRIEQEIDAQNRQRKLRNKGSGARRFLETQGGDGDDGGGGSGGSSDDDDDLGDLYDDEADDFYTDDDEDGDPSEDGFDGTGAAAGTPGRRRRGGNRRRGGAGAGGGSGRRRDAADGDDNDDGAAGGGGHHRRDDDDNNPFVVGEIDDGELQWTKHRGDTADWLENEQARRIIKNRIFNFLYGFQKNNRFIYRDRVHAMARDNAQSFEVSYIHLGEVHSSCLAIWLAEVPESMLQLIDEAACALVYNFLYPHYHRVHKSIRVRISELPLCDPIRDFRQVHRDVLVRVEGVVTRRSPVYPQLQAVRYDCPKCAFVLGPVMQRSDAEVKVGQCPSCHSKGPFKINMAQTEFRAHQSLVLQEPPGKVPPGRLPRSLEVTLTHDLIDRAKPGEEVEVIGVYKNTFDPVLNSRQGFPVFTTVLIANNVSKRTADVMLYRMADVERSRLQHMAQHPSIKKKLMRSVAPSIHGRDDIKLGLLLVLLGGVAKEHHAHRIRGDINALLVGDPGTAKSQFLKFVEKTADRAVFTTGRGSTAVGLTASVHKDPISGEFSLEGGALVIADRGVCLIDEFDKMSDQDRTSIHEAMEQQTISIAKGGIVTTLSARCSVIAAANPVGGRYDSSLSFDANVDLTTPILSRFDLLFVVRDEVNAEEDTRLAQFITKSHQRSHPSERAKQENDKRECRQRMAALANQIHELQAEIGQQPHSRPTEEQREQYAELNRHHAAVDEMLRAHENLREDDDPGSDLPLPQELLRRYILYARNQVRPRISNINGSPLETLFMHLRQESKKGGGIPVTVRHLESILRLSEAHARLHLREFVTDSDVSAAMALFLRCFLQTQKYSMRHALEVRFRQFLESDIEPQHLILNRLKGLVHQVRSWERSISGVEPTSVHVPSSDLEDAVKTMNVGQEAVLRFYESDLFRANGFALEKERGQPARVRHTVLMTG